MKKENKQIVTNSIYLYIRLIIVGILGLIVTRVILKNLGVEDFGIYTVVGGVVSLIGFVNTVMLSVSNRFIAFEIGKGSIESINKIFNICLNVHIILAIFVLIVGLPIGEWYINHYLNIAKEKNKIAIWVFRVSLVASAISFMGVPFNGLIIAKEKFSLYSITEIIVSIMKLFIAYIIYYVSSQKLITYSLLMSFITIFPTIIYISYCQKTNHELVKFMFIPKWKDYKEIFNFSIWVGYGALATIGKSQGANLVINYFFGAVLNTALGIANSINGMIITFGQSIGRAISPQITKSYAAGDIQRTENLVIADSKYTFLLLLLPILPIFLEVDYLLNIWLVEVPPYTSSFIRLILLDALIGSLNAGIPEAIFASGRIKWYQIIINTIFLLSVPVAFFVLKNSKNPKSLLYTYIVFSIIVLIVRQIILNKVLKFNTKQILKKSYSPCFLVVLSLSPLLAIDKFPINPLFTMLFSLIYVITSIFLLGLDKNERAVILKIISNKIVTKIKQ